MKSNDPTDISDADAAHLGRAIEVALASRRGGNHPFGAVLVASDGTILEAENSVVTTGDPTGHAELNLVRLAGSRLSRDQLAMSSLYTSTEPCAMCSGAIYWAGIGRVVYALPEQELAAWCRPRTVHPPWICPAARSSPGAALR